MKKFASCCAVSLLVLAGISHAFADEPETPVVVSTPTPTGDQAKEFLATILATTEDFWGVAFKAEGLTYQEPRLVLFTGEISSPCGVISNSAYCAANRKIYIDPALRDLQKLGVHGEFSQAIMLAREVAHHVQNLQADDTKAAAVQSDLQANCFVGLWSRYLQDNGMLENGELAEARSLLKRLGGDAKAAVLWFNRGFAGKRLADCNA